MERIVGLDLGSKRIGVAVSDGLGLTAQPREFLPRHGGHRDVQAVKRVMQEAGSRHIVLGLPLDLEGDEGDAARRVRAFADRLKQDLQDLDLTIDFMDERFSTVEAEDVLLAANVSRAKRKQVIDKMAAAIILQRWLEENVAKVSTP